MRRRRVDWSHWDGQVDYRTRSQQGEPVAGAQPMYRIRNAAGRYLHVALCSNARGNLVIESTMESDTMASAFLRAAAEHIAAAWIAITGDHAIEIEEA